MTAQEIIERALKAYVPQSASRRMAARMVLDELEAAGFTIAKPQQTPAAERGVRDRGGAS